MPFKEDMSEIIRTITPNPDSKELLLSLSQYMYDTKLDKIISKYPEEIKNLKFPLKISTMLTYLIDIKPMYYNKCILLSYIFFNINHVDIPIDVDPAIVPINDDNNGDENNENGDENNENGNENNGENNENGTPKGNSLTEKERQLDLILTELYEAFAIFIESTKSKELLYKYEEYDFIRTYFNKNPIISFDEAKNKLKIKLDVVKPYVDIYKSESVPHNVSESIMSEAINNYDMILREYNTFKLVGDEDIPDTLNSLDLLSIAGLLLLNEENSIDELNSVETSSVETSSVKTNT